jgi:hypothetical protein
MRLSKLLFDLECRQITPALDGAELRLRAPSGALTPLDLSVVRSRRDEIISYLRARAARPGLHMVKRANVPIPSLAQEAQWFRCFGRTSGQREALTDHAILNAIGGRMVSMCVCGHSSSRVEQAITRLIALHDTLRSRFTEHGGEVVLRFCKPRSVRCIRERLPRSMASTFADANARDALKKYLFGRMSDRRADIDSLFVPFMFELSQSEIFVFFVISKLICDAMSRNLIESEFWRLLSLDDPPENSFETRLQINDFALWERQWFKGSAQETLLNYWSNWLSAQPEVCNPRNDAKLASRTEQICNHATFSLHDNVTGKVQQLCGALSSTPFQIYLAVFGISIAKWLRVEHFPIRCGGHFRETKALSRVIGPLACVDRIDFRMSPDCAFASVVRETAVELAHVRNLRIPNVLDFSRFGATQDLENQNFLHAIPIKMTYLPREMYPLVGRRCVPARQAFSWPPVIRTSRERAAVAAAVDLKVIQHGETVVFRFKFNGGIFDERDVAQFMSMFLSVLRESIL